MLHPDKQFGRDAESQRRTALAWQKVSDAYESARWLAYFMSASQLRLSGHWLAIYLMCGGVRWHAVTCVYVRWYQNILNIPLASSDPSAGILPGPGYFHAAVLVLLGTGLPRSRSYSFYIRLTASCAHIFTSGRAKQPSVQYRPRQVKHRGRCAPDSARAWACGWARARVISSH